MQATGTVFGSEVGYAVRYVRIDSSRLDKCILSGDIGDCQFALQQSLVALPSSDRRRQQHIGFTAFSQMSAKAGASASSAGAGAAVRFVPEKSWVQVKGQGPSRGKEGTRRRGGVHNAKLRSRSHRGQS